MATPDRVKLVCPLSGKEFRARTMGSSYYISGVDTDLRERGSIEEVRRFSIAVSPYTRYADYAWDFVAPQELSAEEKSRLAEALEFDPDAPALAQNQPIGDFERLHLARVCFEARELDTSALAELALLAYYVACDLGRRDLVPRHRREACALIERVLEDDDLPGPLELRYAYLAGELNRRAGKQQAALDCFERAIAVSETATEEDGAEPGWELVRLARRQRAATLYRDAPPEELVALSEDEDPDIASEACRLLASRRDSAAVAATRAVWESAAPVGRRAMLRELAIDPSPALYELFSEALRSQEPEDVRLAARALAALGDPRATDEVLAALQRGVLSTEAALVGALGSLGGPDVLEAVAAVLQTWEEDAGGSNDSWAFGNDTTPLKNLLYTSGQEVGLRLLTRDLEALEENDLWDKVPSGGPVSAALSLGGEQVVATLTRLLGCERAAARRWATYCLAELEVADAAPLVAPLVEDPDQVVRLQAAAALARLGNPRHEGVVLDALRALDANDLPFALHFLVPFRSEAVRDFLLGLLDGDAAMRSEVLPLLGRQEPDERIGELLATGLLDTDDDTRAGAVTGLAYQGGPETVARLRLLYDQEDSDEVLRRIIFGLGSLADRGEEREETVEFLRERLERANPRLRFAVALTLLQLGDPSGIDLVRERAALFDESLDRYDLVAPALKALARYEETVASS